MSFFNRSHVSRKILNAAAFVAAATVLAKIVAMGKEVFVAAQFGTGDAMDAYVIAFTVPAYLINVASGSLNVALIPTYIQVRNQQGKESARDLLGSALILNIGLLLILTAALSLCGASLFALIAQDFSGPKFSLSLSLFAVLLPCVVISGVAVTLEAVLTADERFFGASLAPAVVSLAIVFTVLLFPEWGAYGLSAGTLLGYMFELLLAAVLIRRAGIPLSFRWPGIHPALRTVLQQYIPAVSGSSLMCSAILIDQTMAASLGSGNVAALNYGNKLVAVIVGAVTVALGTAVLPFFSTLVASLDWKSLRQTLRHYVILITVTTVPATLLFVYLSEFLVRLLYQRGAFSAEDTTLVAQIQAALALQIPFHTLGILFVRLLSALKLNYFMFLSNILSVILKIALNYVLMQYWGILGIALSTVGVYVAAAAFMGLVVHRRLVELSKPQVA